MSISNPSIDHVKSMLGNISDINVLMQYAQRPSPPQYPLLQTLAIARISELKQPRAQAPQQTVAQQVEAQAQPQMDMGVASLPEANSVGNEQAYAKGGIVAFDKGGLADINDYRRDHFMPLLTQAQYDLISVVAAICMHRL